MASPQAVMLALSTARAGHTIEELESLFPRSARRDLLAALRTLCATGQAVRREAVRRHPISGTRYDALIYEPTGLKAPDHRPGRKVRLPLSGTPGRVTTALTVWCGDCGQCDRAPDDLSPHRAAQQWTAAGWITHKDTGWICPACASDYQDLH